MANNLIKRKWNQNTMVSIEDLSGSVFQAESGGHTFEISGVDNYGNTVALSGTVAAVFMRADNTDVAISGSASGGVVSVTLPAECYDVPGRFGLTVFVTADSKKTAVYAAIGTVRRTSSGNVAPSTTADVVDLINQINAAIATIPQSWSGLMADIAPNYSTSAVYPVGAYVYYNGDLYRCTTAITTAESWTAGHWTTAVLGQDVSELKSAIIAINDEVFTSESVTYNQSTNPLQEIAGTIKADGTINTDLNHYYHTEFVDVKPGTTVTYINAWAYATYCVVACYDINQNFLASASKLATESGQQSGSLELQNNVYFISLMIRDTGSIYTLQVTKSKSVLDDIDASIDEINDNIEDINSDIASIESELAVIRNVTHNKSVNALSFTLGSITNTGEISTVLNNYYYSEKIAVFPGAVISYKNLVAYNGWCRIAAYDTNESFLASKSLLAESTGFDTGTWTVPDGVAFVSVEAFNPANETINPYEVTVPVRVPISQIIESVGSPWSGKTAVVIGDSITDGLYTPTGGTEGPDVYADPKYWETAGEIIGIGTFVGYGVSGTSISRTSGTLPAYAMSIRYASMIDGADLIIVAGGTNDYGTNVVLGTIADTTDISFYGALHVLCDGLQSKYLGKRIVFITPIHRANEEANSAGYTLDQYRQAIYDVARDVYGFAVIDGKEMAISCANATFKNLYIYDGLHPTQEGHDVFGQALGHKLLTL